MESTYETFEMLLILASDLKCLKLNNSLSVEISTAHGHLQHHKTNKWKWPLRKGVVDRGRVGVAGRGDGGGSKSGTSRGWRKS